MQKRQQTMTAAIGDHQRERLLRMLAIATFVIFFQAYMVAPIIPALSEAFGASVQTVGLLVPAYLIPYGVATLLYGLLADRFGVHRVMFSSLAVFSVLTLVTATAQSVEQLTIWRGLTGLGASGVVPLALALVGRLFPYERGGRPLGWLFGAMAGGMAFGSPLGAMLVPAIGWRGLFVVVGLAGAALLLVLLSYRSLIAGAAQPVSGALRDLFRGYKDLLTTPRGQRTYTYVLVNSIFHSGVFTWLGLKPRHECLYVSGPCRLSVGVGKQGRLFAYREGARAARQQVLGGVIAQEAG
jgi:MFS family permease